MAAIARWDWRLSQSSGLLCALAFNLTFFTQEFFLVAPKALVPGLHPVLFHNNHSWTGHNLIADLLQGTGALADVASGLVFSVLLAASPNRSPTQALLFFWMAFQGFFQALPQVVIGAIVPANDVGTAMAWLGLTQVEKLLAAVIAVIVMAVCGYWLAQQFVSSIATAEESATGGARMRFVLRVALLPALASVLLVVPFREPRDAVEVVLVPLIVALSGMLWVQGFAWRAARASTPTREPARLALPLAALAILLGIFQMVLRPGIRFY